MTLLIILLWVKILRHDLVTYTHLIDCLSNGLCGLTCLRRVGVKIVVSVCGSCCCAFIDDRDEILAFFKQKWIVVDIDCACIGTNPAVTTKLNLEKFA